ncbi:MAG TPA: pseudaminic acid synthase [Chitinophagales bacterium]|nr:pseudaminic acid synthase [Chitinophagales bacterium]
MKKDKVFIIAELSANHNNDFDLAVRTIEAMAKAGADAVKVQTYKPQSLTLDLDTGFFAPRTEGAWKGYTSWNLYTEASMPYEWQPKLKKLTEDLGLIFFSSPFDLEGVDFLESINVPMYKIASLEITDIPLIEYTASKGKPMIISTGVAEFEDIQLAIEACQRVGNNDITLLKCTSQYPATIEQANILTMPDIRNKFGVKVGLSDHTMGHLVPIVAVSLGATVVEKHFILDRNLGGPDSFFSMEPNEFKEMVDSIRQTEKALGEINYNVADSDKNRRRSLFVSEDIKTGEAFTHANIRSIRPGNGLHPKHLNEILGKTAKNDLKKGDALSLDMIN